MGAHTKQFAGASKDPLSAADATACSSMAERCTMAGTACSRMMAHRQARRRSEGHTRCATCAEEAEKRKSADGKTRCETKEMKTCWTDVGATIHGFRVRVGLLQPLPRRSWSGAINAHNLFNKMLELEKVVVSSLM
jgi:hypothetical protein